MAGGITSTGFNTPTLAEIEDEVRQNLLANVSATLDLSSEGPMGQIVTIFARQLQSVWEAMATAWGAVDPNKAEGVLLDNVCALVGVTRLAATKSEVPLTLNLNAAVTVPAGSIVAVVGQPNIQFEVVSSVTSVGSGNYAAVGRALVTGPVTANAGTVTVIVTPVTGWNTVTNATDAEPGRNVETDTELRLRREAEITRPGAATTDAIRADVLAVDGVIECNVFENVTMLTNSDGVPAKSFEIVVWDGDVPSAANADIVEAIWGSKPAGIQAFGTTTASHTDDSGNVVQIGFTRATPLTTYIDITVVTNASFDPVNGPTAVKNALVAKGNRYRVGDDVIALAIRAEALEVPGVVDASVFELGFSASPSGTANLPVSTRQIARFDSSRITVTVT